MYYNRVTGYTGYKSILRIVYYLRSAPQTIRNFDYVFSSCHIRDLHSVVA